MVTMSRTAYILLPQSGHILYVSGRELTPFHKQNFHSKQQHRYKEQPNR